jgi:hypothetical protein
VTAEAPEQTETAPEPETQGETPEPSDGRLPDDHPVVKALAKANKEAEQYRLKVKEYEDSQKSDQDRQAERLAELESTAKSSSLEAARLRVALRKGLTETQAKRLVGDSEEDLEADADELVATFAPPENDAALQRRPQERLRPGASPSAGPEKSPAELADAVLKRQRGY